MTASGVEPGVGDWSLTVIQRGDEFCEDFSTPTGSGGGCAKPSHWLVPHRLSPTVGVAGGSAGTLTGGEVGGLTSEQTAMVEIAFSGGPTIRVDVIGTDWWLPVRGFVYFYNAGEVGVPTAFVTYDSQGNVIAGLDLVDQACSGEAAHLYPACADWGGFNPRDG